ncbi:3510_t:CDS:2, partial [Entrophospora sp. SA101]
ASGVGRRQAYFVFKNLESNSSSPSDNTKNLIIKWDNTNKCKCGKCVKAYPRDVKSYKEAMKIKGIGDRIGNLIKKYFELDTIPEAEKILDDPRFLTLDLFTRVFGVGTKKANEWYNKGYETIDDCKKDPNLTNVQKIGLEVFDDFQKKMTREDVEEIFEILNKEVKSIDSQYFLTIVGGYRRGKEFNGDLDVILSHPEEELEPFILKKIVNRLADK